MSHYVGLDVSLKEVSICVVDGDGEVLNRASVATEPDTIAEYLAKHARHAERVVHESGILATWLTRELERRGVPITCIDARMAHKALSARLNKSDKADAEGLAQLARTGWFTKVHIRSEASDRVRALTAARERLVRMRKDLEAHIRGVLKTFGFRMGPVSMAHHRQAFRDKLAEAGVNDPMLKLVAQTMIPIHKTLCASAEALGDELTHIARQNTLARRLMTVPGVGPLVALNFIATVDDASRFRRSSDVGAFLGLTTRRYQSGEIDRSGRISKCGDAEMRRLLVSAATSLMTQVRRFSPLKSWAMRLSARKGFKKAAVATARKIAVILHAIWRDGTEFTWTKEPIT
jgi:transposase